MLKSPKIHPKREGLKSLVDFRGRGNVIVIFLTFLVRPVPLLYGLFMVLGLKQGQDWGPFEAFVQLSIPVVTRT